MLSESALRLPTWKEGYWATLGDGQRWCLPPLDWKPDLSNQDTEAGFPTICTTIPELATHISLMNLAKSDAERALAIRALMSRLLRANYAIDAEAAETLLPSGLDGVEPGFDGGLLAEATEAIDEVVLIPGMAAGFPGITPP